MPQAQDPTPSVVTYQALESQAYLHKRIADYYRKVAERLHTHGAPIVDDWRQCNPQHATTYEQWKTDFINDAQSQVDWHTRKYTDFLATIEAWQQQEAALGGQSTPGWHFWRGRGQRGLQ
jgi:hypothetical protein